MEIKKIKKENKTQNIKPVERKLKVSKAESEPSSAAIWESPLGAQDQLAGDLPRRARLRSWTFPGSGGGIHRGSPWNR